MSSLPCVHVHQPELAPGIRRRFVAGVGENPLSGSVAEEHPLLSVDLLFAFSL